MMNIIFAAMIIFSVVCGILNGKSAEVSDAAINSCVEAVELFLYLIGGMCMWGGLMKVAEKSHLTDKLAAAFRPFARLIFKNLDLNGKAFHAICLNVTANMLGLGNAATPLGIEAMKALESEEKANGAATRNMIVFSVLNTASITLLPTTAASLRSKHGSAAPMEIFPCVVITSVAALAAGLISAIALDGISKIGHKNEKRSKEET
ncbi:MAG: nucleoside recognition domain-containing protein [Oscillospiraceae bacterium]